MSNKSTGELLLARRRAIPKIRRMLKSLVTYGLMSAAFIYGIVAASHGSVAPLLGVLVVYVFLFSRYGCASQIG